MDSMDSFPIADKVSLLVMLYLKKRSIKELV